MLAKKKWTGSMRWRIVLIYFLLVFIALTIVSVFIVNQLEAYQLNSTRDNLTKTVNDTGMLTSFAEYDNLMEHQAEIQKSIDDGWDRSFREELSIVDKDLIVVASTIDNIIGQSAGRAGLEVGIITGALGGNKMEEKDGVITGNIPVKNLAYPIGEGDDVTGVVYIRADLDSIYDFLGQAKSIFVRAMVLALLVTVVLGFLIARSITVPINDVTEKAERMSQGDFSQEVSVKSDDEIGRLAEMFNLLREKLDFTLSEISNEKSKLETILKYMADGLIAIDLEGTIIHANPAALAMLNLRPEDVESKNYQEILGNKKNLELDTIKENCLQEGGQDIFDHGNSIFAIRYDRFKDEDDEDVGIIMIIQDITERQKLENMQTDFVANVSHELKTPLTTIKSYTETLLDGALEDAEISRNFLSIVDSEADRMNRLVKDLLQLSRIDHQQEKWHMKESNLISLLKLTVTKVEMTARQKQQHLNCLFDPESRVMVMIDKDRIEQVILNILSNSIKYTNEGGRIDIDVVEKDGLARIIVADNGIGMAESEIPRIFERFYRVDRARSRAMGGTGLGLAIAKQIVEEHGGTIEIESQEGKGTKAFISLPLAVRRGISNIE
ncbi:sensor histidine kinase [Bacilliculturomica massiliensis]|uniref:sensor histidine kinase n=1 Tax=Bacilliculturomica massiliensis TaxID=1917867 RepID=UPI0010325C6A|nr:ATP-binding protein [Bacilliculturomica massiliensis]